MSLPDARARHWMWPALLVLITALSLGVRLHYVIHAQVLQPVDDQQHVRGDGVEYYAYARNLVRYHVFSMAPETGTPPPADSFRDPGYPLFLAAWMKVWPDWTRWYAAVLLSQAILSGLAVPLGMFMARRWMPLPWLAAAGVLMALWPHSVAINSFILSESWVGFLAVAGLTWTGWGLDKGSVPHAIGGTAVLTMAALSNAVLIPLVPLGVCWLLACRRINRRTALGLLIFPVLFCGAWQVRGALLPPSPSSSGRALINLDQGSWPNYHAAYRGASRHDPNAAAALGAIDRETTLLQREPLQGLQAILGRMGRKPLHYAAWYASKPWLFWGWDIRMGQGDIYVYPTRHSPFLENGALRALAAMCKALNPFLFGALLVGWFAMAMRRRELPPSLHLAGVLTIYVTLVYTVLQAEPRYSIPFRPIEILLALWAIWLTCSAVWRYRAEASGHDGT
ncbi:hypothetical protein ACFWZU_15105 [Frateuria sp. GZRR33]|uniref:hypothetical protein n=1 Tax=Frateuria sp. GZRR33 TaxID=3351535 RepID=UPI003EDC6EB7